jgi:hypothetical protein
MLLHPPVVSTAQFTWMKEEKMLVTEMSDLQVDFGRVFDDACDVGLTLKSHRTNREVVFAVFAIYRDSVESEITHWDLRPVDAAGRVTFDCTLRIFND